MSKWELLFSGYFFRAGQLRSSGGRLQRQRCAVGRRQSTAFQFPMVTACRLVFTSIHKSNLPGLLVGDEET
jgi:hypothetical protein